MGRAGCAPQLLLSQCGALCVIVSVELSVSQCGTQCESVWQTCAQPCGRCCAEQVLDAAARIMGDTGALATAPGCLPCLLEVGTHSR